MKKILLSAALTLGLASFGAFAAQQTESFSFQFLSGSETGTSSTNQAFTGNPVNFQLSTTGSVSLVLELDEDATVKSAGSFDVYAPQFHSDLDVLVAGGGTQVNTYTPANCPSYLTLLAGPDLVGCQLSATHITIVENSNISIAAYTGPAANYSIEVVDQATALVSSISGDLEASQDLAVQPEVGTLAIPHSFNIAALLDDADNASIGGVHEAELQTIEVAYDPIL